MPDQMPDPSLSIKDKLVDALEPHALRVRGVMRVRGVKSLFCGYAGSRGCAGSSLSSARGQVSLLCAGSSLSSNLQQSIQDLVLMAWLPATRVPMTRKMQI